MVEAIEAARAKGLKVDAEATGHGVVHVPKRGWVKTGAALSPLGALVLSVRTSVPDVLEAVEEVLLASSDFVKGFDHGTRARPDGELVGDDSYLRGLELGYEIRFYLRPPAEP